MTLELLKDLEEKINPPVIEPEGLSRKETRKIEKGIKKRAKKLHKNISALRELVKEHFDGTIDLETDVERINWSEMPPEIAACFRPEFDYQPEDITSFKITFRSGTTGGEAIEIRLKRLDSWWAKVGTGVYYRKDYHSDNLRASCEASQAQIRPAREAMKNLNHYIWDDETIHVDDKSLLKTQYGLQISEAFFEFTIGEIKRQVDTTTQTTPTHSED